MCNNAITATIVNFIPNETSTGIKTVHFEMTLFLFRTITYQDGDKVQEGKITKKACTMDKKNYISKTALQGRE